MHQNTDFFRIFYVRGHKPLPIFLHYAKHYKKIECVGCYHSTHTFECVLRHDVCRIGFALSTRKHYRTGEELMA